VTIEERLYQLLCPSVIAELSEGSGIQGVNPPYTAFFRVHGEPLSTQQEAYAQDLRQWVIQFSSYAKTALLARGETKKIVDYLTTYSDSGVRVCFLRPTGGVGWDGDAQLYHSIAEFEITEALG